MILMLSFLYIHGVRIWADTWQGRSFSAPAEELDYGEGARCELGTALHCLTYDFPSSSLQWALQCLLRRLFANGALRCRVTLTMLSLGLLGPADTLDQAPPPTSTFTILPPFIIAQSSYVSLFLPSPPSATDGRIPANYPPLDH